LEHYGIQLHNLTPGSILHISGFVALCELFLGCEAHFELWKKFFCLVPRHQGGGSIFEVGGAEVWCIVEPGYPVGTPKKGLKNGLRNGSILMMFPFRTQSGVVFPNSPVLP